jgi:ferredoxin-NADP reductase
VAEHRVAGLRQQFHFRPSPNGYHAWDVHRLIALAREFPVQEIALADLAEIDEIWWFQEPHDRPTPRAIAEHFRLMQAVDLDYPVILCGAGRLMDGMHRVLRALTLGHQTIRAVRFPVTPPPDRSDVRQSDLAGE